MNASTAACAIACASCEPQLLEDADLLEQHGEAAAAEEVAALAADQAERARLRLLVDDVARRALDDVGVEAAAQPLVGGDDDHAASGCPARGSRAVEQRVDRRIDARRDAARARAASARRTAARS